MTEAADERTAFRSWSVDVGETGVVHVTSDPRSSVLDRFYDAYDAAFVLPEEKEEKGGLRQCLALNSGEDGERLRRRYGRFAELALTLQHSDGAVAGGANFIAFAHAGGAVTIALSYLFVVAAERRRGHLRRLLGLTATEAGRALGISGGDAAPPLIFVELNDPLAMSHEEYRADSAHAGLDQVERLRIWARVGVRLLDMDYTQPPLSADRPPAPDLILGVLGAAGDALDAELVHRHLERFFAISVLKGGDPERQPDAARQLRALASLARSGRQIRLIDPKPALAAPLPLQAGSFLEVARAGERGAA